MSEADAAKAKPAEPAKEDAAPDISGPIVVALRKPVLVDGQPSKTLSLREPTAGDIEQCGCPVNMDFSGDTPKVTFDAPKMTAMLAHLAAVPPSSIRAMHPKDWATAAWSVAGFFVPDLGG